MLTGWPKIDMPILYVVPLNFNKY